MSEDRRPGAKVAMSARAKSQVESVVVVATVYPEPERRAEVIAAFTDSITQVHAADEGCELYALHEGDARLVVVEKWASPEALAAHSRGSAVAELNERIRGQLVGGLDVQVLRPHPAGTPEQGTL